MGAVSHVFTYEKPTVRFLTRARRSSFAIIAKRPCTHTSTTLHKSPQQIVLFVWVLAHLTALQTIIHSVQWLALGSLLVPHTIGRAEPRSLSISNER